MKFRVYEKSEWTRIHLQQWADLDEASLSINPFYEHWNLLPALEHFGKDKVKLITIESNDAIHALMPVVATKNMGFFGLRSWKHSHCFLSTPLFRSVDALQQLIKKASAAADASFFRVENYHKINWEKSHGPHSTSSFCRASQSLDMTWEDFLSAHSKQRQKEYRRNLNTAESNNFR